jgi:hypothetical protein
VVLAPNVLVAAGATAAMFGVTSPVSRHDRDHADRELRRDQQDNDLDGNADYGAIASLLTLARASVGGGAVVSLASSNPALTTPTANVFLAAGHTRATFTIVTTAIQKAASIPISAAYLGATKSATIRVRRP